MESREDILNNVAGRITNYVHDIGTEPCKLCESAYIWTMEGR